MAYNQQNKYLKIIEIQDLTLALQKQGLTNVKIFELHVHERYHISKKTFDNYLGINAKKLLREYDTQKQQSDNQLKLFNDDN